MGALVALRGAVAPEAFCGVVMETLKLPLAPVTASCEGAGGEVKAAARVDLGQRRSARLRVERLQREMDAGERLPQIAVAPGRGVDLRQVYLSAIAAPAGEERAGEQAAILERKPGIGIRSVGKAHAEALILPPRRRRSLSSFPGSGERAPA
jgi:hypothetical protein